MIIVNVISFDDGIVKFRVIIKISWPSLIEIDDVSKQTTIATGNIKYTFVNRMSTLS